MPVESPVSPFAASLSRPGSRIVGDRFAPTQVIIQPSQRMATCIGVQPFYRSQVSQSDSDGKAIDVIDVLSDLFILRCVPGHIRSDWQFSNLRNFQQNVQRYSTPTQYAALAPDRLRGASQRCGPRTARAFIRIR